MQLSITSCRSGVFWDTSCLWGKAQWDVYCQRSRYVGYTHWRPRPNTTEIGSITSGLSFPSFRYHSGWYSMELKALGSCNMDLSKDSYDIFIRPRISLHLPCITEQDRWSGLQVRCQGPERTRGLDDAMRMWASWMYCISKSGKNGDAWPKFLRAGQHSHVLHFSYLELSLLSMRELFFLSLIWLSFIFWRLLSMSHNRQLWLDYDSLLTPTQNLTLYK